MKKIILILCTLYSLSFSAGTYDGYVFNDYEENGSLYFCNYYDYQSFVYLGLSTADATAIINMRPITSLLTVANNVNITGTDMARIRAKSHIIDWNIYTDNLGMTLTQTNFLYALSGLLFGFVFLLVSSIIAGRK
ncbi:MAG: hypothetical protein JZU49_01950 [Sulfuricurvum sp.]|nr:hypothetical protein [Sulfuricurvum sp.]